jgi:predicted permease
MRVLRRLAARVRGFLSKHAREHDMEAEFEAHFQMHVDDNLRAGMTPHEARRAAALRFGSVDSAKEEVRRMTTLQFIETVRRDLRYALRGMRRNPGFAAAAILSLALGIGASISIFAVADSLLLRPLPFREPDRVVMVWEFRVTQKGTEHNQISPANYRDWKAQNNVFESIAAFGDGRAVLADGERVEELQNRFATADMLPLLGVRPLRGRFFTAAEDLPNTPNVLVISYRLWQSWFSGQENVIGRKVQIRSQPATIIGVLPADFSFGNRNIDLWEAIGFDPARDYRAGGGRGPLAVARLKPGVSFAAAQTQMTAIAKRLEQAYPAFNKNWTVNLEPLRDSLVRDVKTSLQVLLAAVGLLLAVACANVANLLLARCTSRKREIAVRVAIGAGRGGVIRQLITESVTLSLAGGLLGIALARLAIIGMIAIAPRNLAQNASVSIDLRVAGFAFAVSVLTGVLFGLAPALIASRDDIVTGLREGSRTMAGGGRRLRAILVAAEVALSLMLLAGAGLLFRSMVGLQSVDPGLNADRVLTFRVSLPVARYREPRKRTEFFASALEQIRRLPGVRSASAVNTLPINGFPSGTYFDIGGRPKAKPGEELVCTVRIVMPGYFHTMGIPVHLGREFNDVDNAPDLPHRFVVNELFVKRYLAGEQPLGKTISVHMQQKDPFGEIVGVVGDVNEGAVDRPPTPAVYYIQARMQNPGMVMVARTAGDPLAVAEPARRIIQSLDAAQPVADVRTLESVVSETFSRQRFSAVLMIAFSAVSLLLAAVGIYGVLAYTVAERTREFGVRMALGAEPGRITMLVANGAARIVIGGLIVGLAGAYALSGMLQTLLFGVQPHDIGTLAIACAVLGTAAAIASLLPARRAARMMPVDALRNE